MSGNIIGCSCLKLERKTLENCLLEAHALNHLSPTLVRRQAVEPVFLAIQHADTGRAVHLVTTEREEVAVHCLYVYGKVGRTLGTVNQHRHAVFMGNTYYLFHRIDRTEHVADVGHAHDFCPLSKQFLIFVEHKLALVCHRNDTYRNAFLGRLKLPGHDIGVVFHYRHNHFVVLLHEFITKRRSYEIKTLGGATGEYYLACRLCVDKLTYLLTRFFMQIGSLLRQIVHTAVHVCVHVIVLIGYGFYHLARLLGRRGIVKIYQRTVVNRAREYRKVVTDSVDIEHKINSS